MANKIGSVDQAAIGKLGKKPAEAAAENRVAPDRAALHGRADRPAGAHDTVELTGRAKLLARLEASLDTASSVDEARVEELRSAIANGDYELDSASIADAMLRFERVLGK